jgi:hypothetical protein
MILITKILYFDITGRKKNAKGGILKIAQKLIKKPKKYKFTEKNL